MTRIYRVDGKLSCNIPQRVRPKVVVYDETIREPVEPEQFQATLTWFPIIVRAYTEPERTALLLTHDPTMSPIRVLESLDLDTTRPIEVKLYGHGPWLKTHLFHGRYARVWIPRKIEQRLHIRDYDYYPVLIRGWTRAQIKEHRIQRQEETIIIRHLGNEYYATKVGVSWRWELPNELLYKPPGDYRAPLLIKPEEIFGWFINQGGHVEAMDFGSPQPHIIDFEIAVSPDAWTTEKRVAQTNEYAYRNIANRNYALKDINQYPWFAELRCSFLSAYPRIQYQAQEIGYKNKLIEILNITLWNMAGKVLLTLTGYPFLLSDKLESNTIEYIPLFQGKRYTKQDLKHRRGREPVPDYVISEGTEVNEKIDRLDFEAHQFSRCLKYARIINKQMGYYVYDNRTIEAMVQKAGTVFMDYQGFIWKE